MKKILLLFICLVSMLNISAKVYSGSCGDNARYTLDTETGLFSITGTGAMTNYESISDVPWFSLIEDIKTVDIADGITSIGNFVFNSFSGLTSITIPNSVTSVGNYAFSSCSGLTSIVIGNSVTSIGVGAFASCSSLTSFNIPNSVTEIGEATFSWCTGLTSITIPNSVTSIGESAFFRCSGLTSVKIPSSVTSIGSNAFGLCSGLTSVTNPNSVTFIGSGAFGGCTSLTSINIPNSVTSIENSAFANCTSLTSVIIPNSVESIGQYAFEGCSGLTSIEIPNSVTYIGGRAFNGTPWYDNQPDGLVYVVNIAYHYKGTMPENTSITIKEGTTDIVEMAFNGCSGLTEVSIPNSVTSIGSLAFYNCTGLTSMTIPNSVTTIGDYAFADCSSLTSVTCEAKTLPSTGSDLFYGVAPSNMTLYVPASALEDYNVTAPWNEFGSIVAIDGEPVGEDIAINETNFPDEKFRNWVLNSYGQDGVLTENEIATADKISLPSEGIQSLKGIKYFTALKTLYFGDNQVTKLDVSMNTELTYLGCSNNKLTSLDVSKNTKLKDLSCDRNYLTSLDVSKNTALKTLYIYNNQIKGAEMDALVESLPTVSDGTMYVIYDTNEGNVMTTMQVAAAKAKGWIPKYMVNGRWQDYAGSDLAINETNFPDENFRNWVLSQEYGQDGLLTDDEIAKVTNINVADNNIQSLKGIEFFTALTSLECNNNNLQNLDVSKNTALTSLNCTKNYLSSLDVSKCTALTSLSCSSNNLRTIDVSNKTALKSLYCINNLIDFINLSGCIALNQLSIHNNYIKVAAMDSIIAGLPTVSNCNMYVKYPYDGNVMTTAQVASAKAKGWIPYYFQDGWKEYPGSEPTPTEKCETPTISYENGKLTFSCATEGATCQYTITDTDIKAGSGNEVQLTTTYIVSVYATKSGYENSDVVTQEINVGGGVVGIKGDVNEDGTVNGTDIQEVINIIVNAE